MTLYLIGIGLNDEKDITVNGLEAVKKCDKIYLESYTSKLTHSSIEKLEKFYGKKIIKSDRNQVENKVDEILNHAKDKDVALLVIGDPFGATTHTGIILSAKEKGIKVKIIHNTSILNAIGEVGLELYKFGAITSIPFNNKDVTVPIDVFNKNYQNDMHTLFLLDLDPINDKYMTTKEAADYLISKGVSGDVIAVGCGGIGSEDKEIKTSKLKDIPKLKIKPQCLIIPAKKLHFVEEEAIQLYQ